MMDYAPCRRQHAAAVLIEKLKQVWKFAELSIDFVRRHSTRIVPCWLNLCSALRPEKLLNREWNSLVIKKSAGECWQFVM